MKLSIYLTNKVRNFVINQNLLYYNQSILIAVSGGQDSTCLFLIILQLKNQFHFHLGLTYCNHLWKKGNFSQSFHLFKLSYIFSQSLYFATCLKKVFNEQQARDERYKLIRRIAEFYNYQKILTGHTETDYLETLLLNLFRGSSNEGLLALSIKKQFIHKNIKYFFLNNKNLYENSDDK